MMEMLEMTAQEQAKQVLEQALEQQYDGDIPTGVRFMYADWLECLHQTTLIQPAQYIQSFQEFCRDEYYATVDVSNELG